MPYSPAWPLTQRMTPKGHRGERTTKSILGDNRGGSFDDQERDRGTWRRHSSMPGNLSLIDIASGANSMNNDQILFIVNFIYNAPQSEP